MTRWLTAGCVEPSSRAAAVKLARRAADSNIDSACIGGKRSCLGITPPYGHITKCRLHSPDMDGNSDAHGRLRIHAAICTSVRFYSRHAHMLSTKQNIVILMA